MGLNQLVQLSTEKARQRRLFLKGLTSPQTQIYSESGRPPQYSRCNDSGFGFKSASCHIGLGVLVNHDLQVSLLIFKWLQV